MTSFIWPNLFSWLHPKPIPPPLLPGHLPVPAKGSVAVKTLNPVKAVLPPASPVLHDLGHAVMRAMLAANFPWETGKGSQNVVSVEGMDPDGTANPNHHNWFEDIKLVLDGTGKILGGPWEATTHPGDYWTYHPMAAGGAFFIALGPQACWTPGPYHDRTVWRQAEDSHIMGHRDPACTFRRQGAPIRHGDIGVHHHRGYSLPKNNIANAAAGCQVIRLNEDQDEFMKITLAHDKYLANKETYRLMATVLTAAQVREQW